jgi:5-methylcytosine-specific restriction endonuclease McrA
MGKCLTGLRNLVWFKKYGTVKKVACYICGKLLTFKESTLEHILARGLGGKNNLENLDIACENCNRSKAKKERLLAKFLKNNKLKI